MTSAFINIVSMYRQGYAQLSIFAGLDGNQISQLSHFIDECQFPKDTVIFEQGQPAGRLYILLAGAVEIRYKPYDGPPLLVARIEPGGVFGWSAALRRDVYTSGAWAVQDSLSLCILGSNLSAICTQNPQTGAVFLDRLAGVIAERLRSTHTQVLEILTQRVNTDRNYRGGKPR
jgi:CRP-like cAMP-binding protein